MHIDEFLVDGWIAHVLDVTEQFYSCRASTHTIVNLLTYLPSIYICPADRRQRPGTKDFTNDRMYTQQRLLLNRANFIRGKLSRSNAHTHTHTHHILGSKTSRNRRKKGQRAGRGVGTASQQPCHAYHAYHAYHALRTYLPSSYIYTYHSIHSKYM